MLKGSKMRNGDRPAPPHHVTIAEEAKEAHDDVDGDAESSPDGEKSILLKKMRFSGGDGDCSPIENGRSLSVDTGSTVVVSQSKENLDKSCLGKTKRFFKVLYKMVKSVVGLLILLVIYSLLGAFMFMQIENETVYDEVLNVTAERSVLIGQVKSLSVQLTNNAISQDQWKDGLQNLLTNYETTIRDANMVPDNTTGRDTWDFWNSLFFVGTVYTTIGYGHIAPKTSAGKIACMFYAAIGIPLALLVLAELGKRFTVALKFLWAFVRRYYYTGTCRRIRKPFQKKFSLPGEAHEVQEAHDSETKSIGSRSRSGSRIIYGYEVDEEFNLPIAMAVGIVLVYIVLGGMMYTIWEEWGVVDSIYFVFISISTIGFGDILPAHPKFFMMSFIYLFIGLSLVSMCINVAIEFFNKTVIEARLKMLEARHKMGEAKTRIGQKVNQAGKNVKEKAAGLKTNIMDETHKIKKRTDEFRGKRSRSGTPVSQDRVPVDDKNKAATKAGTPDSDQENNMI